MSDERQMPEISPEFFKPIRADQAEVYFEVPERESIIRELAERGPVDLSRRATNPKGYECAGCLLITTDINAFRDPASHEPSCLWRRAKALYPGAPT